MKRVCAGVVFLEEIFAEFFSIIAAMIFERVISFFSLSFFACADCFMRSF